MKLNKKQYTRIMVAILLAVCFLLNVGCTKQPVLPKETLPPATKSVETTPTASEPTLTEETDAALVSLRQAMVETPQVFAVAYFGYQEITDQNMQADPFKIMQENAYWLSKNLPFLMEIPQDRIVGENGELYCIVPREMKTQRLL